MPGRKLGFLQFRFRERQWQPPGAPVPRARGQVTVKPTRDLRRLLPLLNIYCALSLYEVFEGPGTQQ